MRFFPFLLVVATVGFTNISEASKHLLWDINQLSNAPTHRYLSASGNVKALLFKSVDYEGKPTEVFAWYANPDLLREQKNTGKKYPGVVLVHGGSGKAYKEWVEQWAARGYAAIAIDLSGNGADGKKIALAGPDQADGNKFQKIAKGDIKDVWSYHAVASVILSHSLLLSFPEVDATKTCITGISWGGYLTCIAASLDKRFKAAAPIYGCAYFDESDVFGKNLNQLSVAHKKLWMDNFDASVYLPQAKCKFLFINGNKDRVFNVVPYDKTHRLIPENQCTVIIKPNMGHSHPSGWASPEIHYFFDSILQDGNALPKITLKEKRSKKISVGYTSSTELLSAEFYYSTDTISTNEKRIWKKEEAIIKTSQKTINISLPEKFNYGFFHIKDVKGNVTSGELFIN